MSVHGRTQGGVALIRPGTVDDIPDAVRLGLAFHKEADLDWMAPVDPASWEQTLRDTLAQGAILFVAEVEGRVVGMIYGLILPCYFNYAIKFAHELVMYIEPEHRKGIGHLMLSAFESEATKRGAKPIVGAKSHMRVEAMTRMYERRGYRELERYFVKED